MLPIPQAAMFLNRLLLIPLQCTSKECNPFLESQLQCSFSLLPVATSIATSQAAAFLKQQQTSPSPTEFLSRLEKLEKERSPTPVEERNRGSTDSRSVPYRSKSLTNVILPPLEPPHPNLQEYHRMRFRTEKRRKLEFREISHTGNAQLLAVEF